jgi:hypothetical protein
MNTDEIRTRHKPMGSANGLLCWECKTPWRCDAIRLADELDRVRAELGLTQDIAIDYAELYEATTKPRL